MENDYLKYLFSNYSKEFLAKYVEYDYFVYV